MRQRSAVVVLFVFGTTLAFAADPEMVAERGRRFLTEKVYIPAIWSRTSYDDLWKRWEGVTAKPADYDRAVREVYGLHVAPFPNNGLPMGLREGPRILGKGLAVDCTLCHGGSILGRSYIGLGNTALDVQ